MVPESQNPYDPSFDPVVHVVRKPLHRKPSRGPDVNGKTLGVINNAADC